MPNLQLNSTEVVDDNVAAILRAKSPAERIQMAAEANDMARLLIVGAIRATHSDWSDERVQEELAKRMLNAAN